MTKEKLLKDQLAYYDSQTEISLLVIFILSLILTTLFWREAGPVVSGGWFAASVAVLALRLLVSRSYRKAQNSASLDLDRYYRLFFLGLTLSAVAGSIGIFLFFDGSSISKQVILVFIYTEIISGAVLTMSVRREFFYVYHAFIMLPLISLLLAEGTLPALTMAVTVGVYGLFLFSSSIRYSQMINEGIRIRYENTDLVLGLEKANKAMQEASKAKSQFLAYMSHEIRTPMTAILGLVEHLAKGEKEPSRLKEFDIIRRSGNTLLSIINDILDLSKIESGNMSLDAQPINTRLLFEEITALFSESIAAKKICFEPRIDMKLPECLMLDEVRVKQVIFNLISNAVKFTPEAGEISMRVRYNAGTKSVYCAIEDNGIGIAAENMEKIFRSFGQEDSTTTRRFGGSGLGLTISSRLVAMMDGKLDVESAPGEGSRFYFEIPAILCREEEPESVSDGQNGTAPVETAINGHVLVVEDKEFNQMLMGIILEEHGLTCDMAAGGVEALALFKVIAYDAILMDENMPNMNGIEATRQMRSYEQNRNLRHMPIIAVTANALSEDRQRFLEAGMDDYISKPYVEEDILGVLRKYLPANGLA